MRRRAKYLAGVYNIDNISKNINICGWNIYL